MNDAYPVFFLQRPRTRHTFNLVVPVPPDMALQMNLKGLDDPGTLWVMHLCRLVLVADQDEALMVFDALHDEMARQQGGWNKDRTAKWQNERNSFLQMSSRMEWPQVMTAPQMPFVVNVNTLVNPEPNSDFASSIVRDQEPVQVLAGIENNLSNDVQ